MSSETRRRVRFVKPLVCVALWHRPRTILVDVLLLIWAAFQHTRVRGGAYAKQPTRRVIELARETNFAMIRNCILVQRDLSNSRRTAFAQPTRVAGVLALSASTFLGCAGEANEDASFELGVHEQALTGQHGNTRRAHHHPGQHRPGHHHPGHHHPGQHRPGKVVLDWVENSFETVRSERIGTPWAGRMYAMTFAAMFDAVNGVNRQWGAGYTHALVPPDGAPWLANRRAAAAAAAHTVLVGLAPNAQPALDAALEASLDKLRIGVAAGVSWGQYVGAEVLELRSSDGTEQADIVTPTSSDPGVFRTTFNRNFANMIPFAIDSAQPYLLGEPPPALTTSQYASGLNEVFVKGSDQDTDLGRQDIALQWETPAGTIRPTGSAIQAAVALARAERTDRRLTDTARLFALIGMTVADSLIPIWSDKATYMSWRPKSAIRRADEDGNPDTLFDPAFQTRFGSTGGSPEYPSGQAAFTSAVATVLEEFYRDDNLSWCFGSDSNPEGRCYSSARAMGDEGGLSRIHQGVHFLYTVEASRPVGNGVAREVATTALRSIREW